MLGLHFLLCLPLMTNPHFQSMCMGGGGDSKHLLLQHKVYFLLNLHNKLMPQGAQSDTLFRIVGVLPYKTYINKKFWGSPPDELYDHKILAQQ